MTMDDNTAPIIGLEKEVVDPRTDAQPSFHVLAICQIVYPLQSTAATLYSYQSRASKDAGKKHVTLIQVKLPGVPSGAVDQWVYEQVIASASDANILTGATPVREVA